MLEYDPANVIVRRLTDVDEVFATTSNATVLTAKDCIDNPTEDYAAHFFEMSVVTVNGDTIERAYTCSCGRLEGRPNEYVRCSTCTTPVLFHADERPTFIEAPPGVKFLNSSVIAIFADTTLKDAFLYVVDRRLTSKTISKEKKRALSPFMNMRNNVEKVFGRPFAFDMLLTHFKEICQIAANTCTAKERNIFKYLIHMYETKPQTIHSNYMLLPPSIFVTVARSKNAARGFRTLSVMKDIINTYIQGIQIAALNNTEVDSVGIVKHLVYNQMLIQMVITNDIANKKNGIKRHNIDGGRKAYSFYALLSQMLGKAQYTDAVLPWTVCVNLYREAILHGLINKYDMTYSEATEHHFLSYTRYSRKVHNIMTKFAKGRTITLHRPPVLHHLSYLTLSIVIGSDPHDKTIQIHPLLFAQLAADTDGDNLLGQFNLSEEIHRIMGIFRHTNSTLVSRVVGEPFHGMQLLKTTAYAFTLRSLQERGQVG